jgi:hypothetical protein
MLTLELRDGVLRPCADHGMVRRLPPPPVPFRPPSGPFSKRERRYFARRGHRGRRGARRIGPVVPPFEPRTVGSIERAHRLSNGRVEVRLYLPDGQPVTTEILAMVDWYIRITDFAPSAK